MSPFNWSLICRSFLWFEGSASLFCFIPVLARGGKLRKKFYLNFDTLELYFHISAVSIGVTHVDFQLLTLGGAHAQRGLQYLVCLSVCYHDFCHHAQQTGKIATPAGSELHWLYLKFVKVPHSEIMAWKPSEQANMQISTGLPRQDVLALRTLEAQDVTTKGVYRLPHAIYYCS